MIKLLVILGTFMTLAGCSLLNIDQYHQETLGVIQETQKTNNDKFIALDSSLKQQQIQLISLQNEINQLEKTLDRLGKLSEQSLKKQSMGQPSSKSTTTTVSIKPEPRNEIVLGEVEHVAIDTVTEIFDARVDTGAATSSLNAINIEEFERNGKDWVKFQLDEGEGSKKTSEWIEAPVVRYVRIRQASSEESERRAVVDLWVKLGSLHEKAEFTLADRSQMTHPILLGREFIRDIALVDVSRKYIHSKKNQ